jgi:GntR family transcriptional regulator, transcriptional repressor for pyruvate dehydrogenase complex
MTRQITLSPRGRADNKPLLKRLVPSRNLTEEVVDQLASEIRRGQLPPGSRLPTEQELMTALGVSRTVVREAIAALRSEGLVVTRQGSGAYVASDASKVPFRLAALDGSSSIADVLKIMELRLAVELEAAALAAERATPRQVAAVRGALAEIERAIARGEGAVKEDFAFHRSIADATGNPHFPQFLEFLGRYVIPRQSIRLTHGTPQQQRRYLETLQTEHGRIADAIKARDPMQARRAMRNHLSKSLGRYRKLAEQIERN